MSETSEMSEMNDEAGRVEAGRVGAGPVLEGVVVGHAACSREGCTALPERVIDPFALEVHGEQVEIDVCGEHLAELYDEI